MPLADERGGVTCVSQMIRQRAFLRRQTDGGIEVRRADGIELEPEPCLVTPGQEAPRAMRRSRAR
jgi:hypothetical protein